MEKPLSVAREDFVSALTEAINNSRLPACVVFDVMRVMTSRVEDAAREQYAREKAAYTSALVNDQAIKEKKNED